MSLVTFNILSAVLFHVVPAILTYSAAIAPTPEATRKWLVFWICHTCLSVVELVADLALSHRVAYAAAKACAFFYLVFLGGATALYDAWLCRVLNQHEADISRGLGRVQAASADGALKLAYAALQRLNPQQLLSAGLWATSASAAAQAAAAAAPPPPPPPPAPGTAGSSVATRRSRRGTGVLSPEN